MVACVSPPAAQLAAQPSTQLATPLRRSIRARLAVRHTLMLAAIVLVIEVGSYLAVRQFLVHRGDRLLESATNTLVRDFRAELTRGRGVDESIATTLNDVRFRDVVFGFRVNTRTSGAAPGAAIEPGAAVALESVGTTYASEHGVRRRTETIVERGVPIHVTAERQLEEDDETLEVVWRSYVVAAALAILLSAFVTWRMASAALAPIETLTARAAAMGSRDLHERLPVTSPDDELGRLTTVLNEMLARLESAFAQQRQFVADASHELRTPVAVLRTELDVTRAKDNRSPDDYRDTLTRLDRVTARLERLVSDLFLLARADAGGLAVSMAAVDIAQLVRDTTALLQGIADDRNVVLTVNDDGDAIVHGSEQHLERALLNVIDNALRFAPPSSTVTIAVSRTAQSVIVDVTDEGPGVDLLVRDTLFGRFRRTVVNENSRHHDGAGLGLAIAQALVGLHGGTLTLRDAGADRTGSTFRFVLPVAT